MHGALRAAGFSLMTMFVSCGVGAQTTDTHNLDTRIGPIAMDGRPVLRPERPQGFENNWVQTLPGKHWFSYFRLYAPTEAYFDKSWKLDDIQAVE